MSDAPKSNPVNAPDDRPIEVIVREKLASQGSSFRPEVIANALGISGKVVRAYLRQTFPRPLDAKGTTWVLNVDEATKTVVHFKTRTNAANGPESISLD